MPLAQNGRGIRGLVWTDSDGQPHTILLAYLGDKVVWDGHIHETIQVPAMAGLSALPVPVVGSASLVEVPLLSALADLPTPALVGGGVTISPDGLSVDAVALAPVLHSDHTLDIEVAVAVCEMPVPDIRVVFGVTPPSMTGTSVLLEPSVFADATVSPPEMVAFVEVRNPDVGSWAIIEPPAMAADAAALTPAVAASSRVDGEVATGTALHPVPTLAAGSAVAATTSSATAGMQVPEILSAGPSFVTAATGVTTVSITVPEGGTIVAFSYDNTANSVVTCSGGVTMTSAAVASSNTTRISHAVGVPAGTYTVTMSGSGGAFRTMIVAAYQGVTAVSGGVSGGATNTTPTLTPTGTGLLAVAGFRGSSMPSGTTTSTGDIRSRATNATQPMDLILVDRSTTPVSLSLASSTSWIGVGLWLA
ncbi:hypothetical protein [Gordonia malaquae]|uniref:hypothetical protein n=1 Tax=Gordonia malaquae TaxID=410332 RepID=UPI0030192610